MRRVEQLITQVRRATDNTRIGVQDGISDEEFIQYLNDAQELCESGIRKVHAKAFVKEKTWSATGAEAVALPFDIWARQNVVSLEYSASGLASDYYKLDKRVFRERFTVCGRPSQYVLMNNQILIDSYPTTGSFRLIYNYKLPRLDKRRSTVSARTLSATQLTALTLTITSPFAAADYALNDYLSVVDEAGTVLMSGIPFTAVNASTGVVTLRSSFTFATGETAPISSWVCLGANATPTCVLSDECEKFLLTYASRRIMDRDSNDDRITMTEDEKVMLGDIIDIYGETAEDIDEVPVTNHEYFDDGDLW